MLLGPVSLESLEAQILHHHVPRESASLSRSRSQRLDHVIETVRSAPMSLPASGTRSGLASCEREHTARGLLEKFKVCSTCTSRTFLSLFLRVDFTAECVGTDRHHTAGRGGAGRGLTTTHLGGQSKPSGGGTVLSEFVEALTRCAVQGKESCLWLHALPGQLTDCPSSASHVARCVVQGRWRTCNYNSAL